MEQAPYQFSVEGTNFVLGLFWQPLSSSVAAERAKEIASLASEMAFDLYVVRSLSSTYCVGFTKSGTTTIRPGTMSAAAAISKTMEVEKRARDFIYVSSLPDGRWVYVAQRDGVILPDGDRSLASEDAARACLLDHISLGDWPVVIAPGIWGIPGSEEIRFQDMLPKKKNGKLQVHKWWRLLPVDKKRIVSLHAGKTILISLLVLAAMGGVHFYKKWKAEKDAKEAAEIAALQRDASGKALPPPHPWKSLPLASDMLQACISTLAGQRLFPGNWDINEVTCADGRLTVTWKPRPGGWIAHLKEIAPGVVVARDGTTASVGSALPGLPTGLDEPAPIENDRLISMYATAQRYGLRFTVTDAAPPPPVLPGQQDGVPVPDWKEINWKAEGVGFPEVVLSALDGAGFRMKAMRATWQNGIFIWTMEGTQYVQP